jgi:uroporphyrin-III C-methyltransferase / precorrin-2 dehydrogenase / sirohydrochlorin ferrochelatase
MSGGASDPPRLQRPPRMAALARLPIFLALDGKRTVVAGDGPAVAWKAELLSAAGADVAVFAEPPCEELRAVAAHPPRGAILLQDRAWQAADFLGAAVAVAGFDDERDAKRFADAARAAGVPVNVIDKPAYCDFSFGAIVNRSPLVIGISTDGAAPVFSQAIRARLEAMIPSGFAGWAEAALRWRKSVQSSGLSSAARRRFWRMFTGFAVAHPDRKPAQSDFESLLRQTETESALAEAGTVTLVGAGPGDPELLTLRALRALQSADVILIDDLVPPEILDFARREASKILIGKTGHVAPGQPDDINTKMIALAKSGKRVVWLKHGDPAMLSRPGSAIAACRAAGIAIEVVPGIAAAADATASILLERFFALAADRRQRDQDAKRQRGDQEAEADRPL